MKSPTNLGTFVAIALGLLAGLYIVGKLSRRHPNWFKPNNVTKVKGENMDDLMSKLSAKQKDKESVVRRVTFNNIESLSYENIAEWVNSVDMSNLDVERGNFSCVLYRPLDKFDDLKIDISPLSEIQKKQLVGAIVLNTDDNSIIAEKWFIAQTLADDIVELFGGQNTVVLK